MIAGQIGAGKTHMAIALSVQAARRYRLAFVRAADLVRSLPEARDERTPRARTTATSALPF